ncbi:hypothetical protein NQ318_011547 [Aromia moschata]|uniref:Uncharacterized protein n=1 Tax=Aromia moschata TaxID=1265417 RepID=A0AAV8Z965_9CUCU|nr:hypothetical protein NQ318_011547 [Aromia moschata]
MSFSDEISTKATNLPELIEEESNQITTVVIFVISAVLTITLLFAIAIFIDCRQESFILRNPEKILRMKMPVRIGKVIREDETRIADNMEHYQPSSSNVIV